MADLILPQQEADDLIKAPKLYEGNPLIGYPAGGDVLDIRLHTIDGRERFNMDVSRSSVKLTKLNHNLRVRTSIVLLRLDVDGPSHRNPDGVKIGGTHLHIYREGYGAAWAYEVDPKDFPNLNDLPGTLRDFMKYCNVVGAPSIEGLLF